MASLEEADVLALRPGPPGKVKVKRRKRVNKLREADERAKVDYAMELLESAQRKAEQQKQEYGKYLKWKVKMQRRERRQREKEEDTQRERMEQHLEKVLREHREQKRRDAERWKNPQKPRLVPSHPRPLEDPYGYYGGDEMLPAATRPLRRAIERRAVLPPPAAELPDDTSSTAPHPPGVRFGRTAPHRRLVGRSLMEKVAHPSDKVKERITFEDVLRLPNILAEGDGAATLEDFLMEANTVVHDPAASSLAATSPPIKPTKPITAPPAKQLRRAKARLDRMEAMFDKAQKRRQHATDLMLADPPADYLQANDLLRYIPAEFLSPQETSHVPMEPSEKKKEFFLTAVDETRMKAAERKTNADGTTAVRKQKRPRVGRGPYRHYNPNPNAKPLPPRPVTPSSEDLSDPMVQQRLQHKRMEEYNSLHQYLEHVDQYTRIHNRAEATGSKYTWRRRDVHTLPSVSVFNVSC